jgi:hypothetical protein
MGLRPFFLPLFTGVRGIGILGSSLPTRKNVAKNSKYAEKESPRPSKFIADSSPPANKEGKSREGGHVGNGRSTPFGHCRREGGVGGFVLLRRPGHGTGRWQHLAAPGAEGDRCGCLGFRHRAVVPRAGRGPHESATPPMSSARGYPGGEGRVPLHGTKPLRRQSGNPLRRQSGVRLLYDYRG